MAVKIRQAQSAEDVAAVRSLMLAYGEFLRSNPAGSICLGGYETELRDLPGRYGPPDGALLLATVDDAPAGCLALRPLPEEDGGDRRCEMKRLWVAPASRGLSLGRLLVEQANDWARLAGYGWMYLDTVPAAMPEANRLYTALGFEQVERYNGNPVKDVAFFRRRL